MRRQTTGKRTAKNLDAGSSNNRSLLRSRSIARRSRTQDAQQFQKVFGNGSMRGEGFVKRHEMALIILRPYHHSRGAIKDGPHRPVSH